MLIKVYHLILLVCCVAGVMILWQKKQSQVKPIALLAIYTFIVEWSDYYLRKGNNSPQYNVFILTEFLFYAYFFTKILFFPVVKKAAGAFLLAFPIFWYFMVFYVLGIKSWNSYVFLIGGFCSILWCMAYFFQLLRLPEVVSVKHNSIFWIVVGIAVFYITVVPYMGMYNYLGRNIPWLAEGLKPVLQISNIIMYTLFAYALICQLRTTNIRKLSQ